MRAKIAKSKKQCGMAAIKAEKSLEDVDDGVDR